MNPPIFVFSGPWFGFIGLLAVVGLALYGVGRRLDESGRRKLLIGASCVNLGCFVLYMIGLLTQSEFPAYVVYNMPLQLCSLATFSLIPAIVLRVNWLRGLVYFIGCLAGFLALFSPASGIEGVGVLTPLSIGFFGSHGLNVVIGALIAALGLYRPSYREAFKTLGAFGILVAIMAMINLGVRTTVLAQANYFYFFDPEGAQILVLLHNWVGLPVLYLLPVLPLVVGALVVQAALYRGGSRLATRLAARPGRAVSAKPA
ncbi:MAG: YwaF family protein [Bifidobacteriaceae bacterium]|nr:YwaF family protein [Bifidobacteriaceae bacterium]